MNNGLRMPKVGLGTYRIKEKEPMIDAISKAGYRHLDTAFIYENEEVVGAAIAASGVKREDLFVVTKIRHT